MIDDLRAMAIFATVAETGSFSAAGRQLRLATSGISQHVTKLEDRLGVTLFYRSTRSLSLTNEGKRLLEHTQRMMTAAEDGLNSIVDISNEPAGALIITLPAFMAGSTYEQAIWSFTRQHQAVAVTIKYLDRNFDLVAEGIDLALRMGELPDSALRSRRLGSFGRKLVCAPSYLKTLPPIRSPDDLKNADFVAMEGLADQVALLKDGEEQVLHTGRGRVLVDNFAALRSALCAGLGIQRLPAIVADTDLKSGALVEILSDWKIPDLGTYGVWPDTSRRSSLTRLLIDHIVANT
ncbi:LysR family transcriptional regulator [Aliiroseovarius crassostreae]|uniref:LysR family transcriptional regulator n=1 Tax=Aliiroseovarius crassostreae TaxID=154981 RepID=UPI00220DDDE0|nr:LysR family transcriptional regulator [Aliiroseovarius crassostreae]UWP98658.1 LysR family transcriptional regulator [Aliiroseovarius crassostreae]